VGWGGVAKEESLSDKFTGSHCFKSAEAGPVSLGAVHGKGGSGRSGLQTSFWFFCQRLAG